MIIYFRSIDYLYLTSIIIRFFFDKKSGKFNRLLSIFVVNNCAFMIKINTYIVFLLLLFGGVSFGQNEISDELLITDLGLDIDETVLTGHKGMFYYNENDPSIVMIAYVATQGYDIAKKQLLENENEKREIKVLSVKENLYEGFKSMFQEGFIEKEGVKLYTYSYLVEYSKNQTFFLLGCTKSKEEKHLNTFSQAAKSILKKIR